MKKNDSVKVKEMEMSFLDCLSAIGDEMLDEMYEEYKINDKKRVSKAEKIEVVFSSIFASLMVMFITLSDKELKEIGDLISGKNLNNVNDVLLYNHYVFEIDGNFVVPTEIKEIYERMKNDSEMENGRKNLIISTYMQINGVLEINKLIELAKLSGVKILKKDIKRVAKECEFKISDDRIYFCDVVFEVDKNIDLVKYKDEREYKIVTLMDAMKIQAEVNMHNYIQKLDKVISKGVKNKKLVNFLVGIIYEMVLVGGNYDENIDELLLNNRLELSEKVYDELFDLVDKIYANTPSFELNGEYPRDIFVECEENIECMEDCCEDRDCCDDFYDLDIDEQKELFVGYYMLVNGVMHIDKMLDILKNEHGYKITKRELLKIVGESSEFVMSGDYICIEEIVDDLEMILMLKNGRSDYKIIDDINEFLDDCDATMDRIDGVCLKYGIESISDDVQNVMSIGIFYEEILRDMLSENDIKLSDSKIRSLFKELNEILKNVRAWALNGYKRSEIGGIKNEKIGRNDPCVCGSGKKYKKCCGK